MWGGDTPSPPGERSGKRAVPPPQNFFLIFELMQKGEFWCIQVYFFAVD